MNKGVTLFLLLCGIGFVARSQSPDEIKNKPEFYLWGEGEGTYIDEADEQALHGIASQISLSVESKFSSATEWGKGKDLKENIKSVINTYSSVTLHGATRIVVTEEPNAKVFRYIKKEDIAKIFEQREEKIFEFVRLADKYTRESKISDALRHCYWAGLFLKSHPKQGEMKLQAPPQLLLTYIPEKINEILGDVSIKVLENTVEKNQQTVKVQFLHKQGPVQNVSYTYYTGRNWTAPEFASEGIGLLNFTSPKQEIRVKIEYAFKHELRTDKEVENVQRSVKNTYFRRAEKRVSLKKEEQEGFPGSARSVVAKMPASSLTSKELKAISQSMESILAAVKSKKYAQIGPLATANGKDLAKKLLEYGNARIIGQDSLSAYGNQERIKVHAGPVQFSFPNNNTKFTERAVFHFLKNNQLDDITFALSKKTQEGIMGYTKWDIKDRHTLIDFLEHYKTAYALKRLDYLESIFSENALIIVGKVVKESPVLESRYKDNVKVIQNQYTKKQYINNLRYSFQSKEYINIRFEDIQIKRSSKNENLYGIEVKQRYFSSNYGDVGYLFLLADLKDKNRPVIHVRTWQEYKGMDLAPYNIHDF